MTRLPVWMLSAAFGAAFLFVGVGNLAAHSWYTGQVNEKGENCCNLLDCRQLADGDVTAVPGGYSVKSMGGLFVPNSRAQPSQDDHYHLCYWGGQVRCFFYPPGGV